jgi:hypothetical protein
VGALQGNLVNEVVSADRLLDEAPSDGATDPAQLMTRRPLGQTDNPRGDR